ncbi:MAG: glycine cleavage system aminomethyltransferase GcvT [Clostridia bacterium]|nr:glycine cleavage system aminomethyltransferase GcvT [Clostridia bacterium]
MSELRRTPLYALHTGAGASMVDFGGWEMPMQYPGGIVEEHQYTRAHCGIFDVSHMGRFIIEGPERTPFLQHVLSSNVQALELNQAQYAIIPDFDGGAVDDAYLYRFTENNYLLVVNAANAAKDWAHLTKLAAGYDVKLHDRTAEIALISVQGPDAKRILASMSDYPALTEPVKNALNSIELDGVPARIAKTGYTGEPIGYELFLHAGDAPQIWRALVERGARPVGLGARDTLRLEAGLPLYGHELGRDRDGGVIPIFAVPLAKFAVSFSPQKGDFVGRAALEEQFAAFSRIQNRDFSNNAALPKLIRPVALLERGVARQGAAVYKDGREIGYITSGTMVPYFKTEGEGLATVIREEKGLRSIALALIDATVLKDDEVEVDIRGQRVRAVVPPYHMRGDAPPFARPILAGYVEPEAPAAGDDYLNKAIQLIRDTQENHLWRQEDCVNLIPSEMSASRAVRLLCAADPSFRYAEHKKVKSFYDHEVFYYQGTKFIDRVERLLVAEMKKYLGCAEVETRVVSGQMSNTAVFSALMDFKNRTNRKRDPQRLGYVMNNHIIKGGHLSAQPMGALHDYIAVDPVTERAAIVNFPVCRDNVYRIDVPETKKLIEQYKPEFIIFGKSMVLHREPVAAIRQFADEIGLNTTIMYDMAHVLGLVGEHFQKPFEEGAEIVTGSTHKTFFGPQRGVIGVNYREGELKYELWESIENRAFPGSVSNHHLGTQLGLLMAAYEMNAFRDAYQSAVIRNAKSFARACKAAGLDVAGDPDISYTETHQVILRVGYGAGPEIAEKLEENGVIVNYQATPEEEGFTASGALRMGVSEMTRFGFGEAEFEALANLMADLILGGRGIRDEVKRLRAGFTDMRYCFSDEQVNRALDALCEKEGL